MTKDLVKHMKELKIVECESVSIIVVQNENDTTQVNVKFSDDKETVSFNGLDIFNNTQINILGMELTNLSLVLPTMDFLPAIKILNVENVDLAFQPLARRFRDEPTATDDIAVHVDIVHEKDNESEIIQVLGITTQQLYFYLVIILSGLLGMCVLVVIPIIVCCFYKRYVSKSGQCLAVSNAATDKLVNRYHLFQLG